VAENPSMTSRWRPTEPPKAETAFSGPLPAPASSRTITWTRCAEDGVGVAALAAPGPARPARTSVAAATVATCLALKGTPPQVTPKLGAPGGVGPRWVLLIPCTSLVKPHSRVRNRFGTECEVLNGAST